MKHELLRKLLQCQSVSPNDANCQQIIADVLVPLGFSWRKYNIGDTTNSWFSIGKGGPVFCFLGHTDVVPAGSNWDTEPFSYSERDNKIYGRGTADMKGAIASMVEAIVEFMHTKPNIDGTIAILLTSDEESSGKNGIKSVIPKLQADGIKIDYCLVGEPSSNMVLGDTVKIGRRGSLHGKLICEGIQGHVAYPEKARNPIHLAAPVISKLAELKWDDANIDFPSTSFQISNIKAGEGATNVIPGSLEVNFNLRFPKQTSVEFIQQRIEDLLDTEANFPYSLTWQQTGEPFITARDTKLVTTVAESIHNCLGFTTKLATSGGTSDGRFIAPLGTEVVELGHLNATIHAVNENIPTSDVAKLSALYLDIISNIFLPTNLRVNYVNDASTSTV